MMGEDFFSTAGLEARGESRDRLPPPQPVLLRANEEPAPAFSPNCAGGVEELGFQAT